jgi:glutamate--cysteine ligase
MQNDAQLIPELNTEQRAGLDLLEARFISQKPEIEAWLQAHWDLTAPPVYGSVDLRNAGFKLAPIDMNLFPAGFNNLNPKFLPLAVEAASDILKKIHAETKNILLIPENHTRNLNYWQNIKTLCTILEQAGFELRLGMLDEEIQTQQEIILQGGERLILFPLIRLADKLVLADFEPDLILLNNDLSAGIPKILQNLQQKLVPPAELGWSQRLKSGHFQYYAEVAQEFAEQFDLDPWLIAPLFRHCGAIDFMQQEGNACLIEYAQELFTEIEKKYAQYQIPYQPFVIIKADAGTYGMAVMTIRHLDELKSLNRKQRTRMSMTKGKKPVHRVIIQEGIYTFETLGPNQHVAEPVVYLWGSTVVGGFYRMHESRGIDENLNSPGMHFQPISFTQSCEYPCRFYTYGVIARLSMLAAAREIKDELMK